MNEDSNTNLCKKTLGKEIMEKLELEKGWKKKVVTVQHGNQKSKTKKELVMQKVKNKLKKGEEVQEEATNEAEAGLESKANDETKGGVKEK